MTSTILRPLDPGLYTNAKGVCNFYPYDVFPGPNTPLRKGIRIGDTNGVTLQVAAATERVRNSNEYSRVNAVKRSIGEVEVTSTIAAVMMSDFILSAAVMGEEGVQSQAAESGVSVTVSGKGVYKLRHYNIQDPVFTLPGGKRLCWASTS